MKEKIRKIVEILYKTAIWWVVFVVVWFLAAIIYGGYSLGKLTDECVADCVLPDKSNYSQCWDQCD